MEKHDSTPVLDITDGAVARLYRSYTSTSALVTGDLQAALRKNTDYFSTNFARHLPLNRDVRILEIGCGYGKNLFAMHELGYKRLTGIDFSEEQVALAQNQLGFKDVHFADAIKWLSGTDEKFDCIILIDVLEHLDLPSLVALGEMLKGHLTQAGRVIAQVPNAMAPMSPLPSGDLTHVRAFTPQSMAQFFANAQLALCYTGGVKSENFIKRFLRGFIVNPLLKLVFVAIHGRYSYPLIFTVNLIVVAENTVSDS